MIVACAYCGEPILPGDHEIPADVRQRIGPPPETERDLHLPCSIRMAVGSFGHQLGLCSCPGCPGVLDDPPDLTVREAAVMAFDLYKSRLFKLSGSGLTPDQAVAEVMAPPRPAAPGFTCPKCGATSFNPHDLAEGYCGRCCAWTGTPGPTETCR